MKRIVKITSTVLFMISLILSMAINTSAYELLGGKFILTNGFIMDYKIDRTTITDQETINAIRWAFEDWRWHLNSAVEDINMNAYFIEDISGNSDITIRAIDGVVYDYGRPCQAVTRLYKADDTPIFLEEVLTTNWVRAEIIISTPEFAKMTSQEKKATITHEIGHVFGLAHNPDNGTIMYETLDGCTAYVPTLDDIQGVYAIYGDQL